MMQNVNVDPKELTKSLGLQLNGDGKGAEVWYVGPAAEEQSEDLPYRPKDAQSGEEQALDR